jgi:hypothetical protein
MRLMVGYRNSPLMLNPAQKQNAYLLCILAVANTVGQTAKTIAPSGAFLHENI